MVETSEPTLGDVVRPLKRTPLTHSPLGLTGLGVIVIMLLACGLSLPFTLGKAVDPGDVNGRTRPRYDLQALDATLLPPSWVAYSPEEQASLDEYYARLEQVAAERDVPVETPRFFLGTDPLGRDFFIRCLAGGGISLTIGLLAAAISVFIGTLYGMIAGYAGGRTDAVMMRVVDVLYGLPYILLVVLLAVAMDGILQKMTAHVVRMEEETRAAGLTFHAPWWYEVIIGHSSLINMLTLLIAIGGVSWLTMARVIRGQVLSLREQPFMEACRAIGVPVHTQFLRHLLPNLLGPIIVYATLTVPQAILQESFLSFLGIGIKDPLPSWGNLAADGLSQLNPVHSRWWLLLWPCVLLGVTLLALNFVGEGLREAFDPRRRTLNAT